jgi:SlyX protein
MNMQEPLLTESRVIDLEIRLTHQEATLQELNAVLIRQQRMIDALALQVSTLREQLHTANTPLSPADDAPPPHY